MTSPNRWFNKLKSGATFVQETAKIRYEKLTETLDKKLKEAQEDLEKQRLQTEAPKLTTQPQQIWRPSLENPNGEIITIQSLPSIILPTTLLTNSNLRSVTFVEEPPTIPHPKGRRGYSKRNGSTFSLDSEFDSGNEQRHHNSIRKQDVQREISFCLNDIINKIIEQQCIDECLNEIIDIITTVDQLIVNVTLNENLLIKEKDLTNSSTTADIELNETNQIESMLNLDDSLLENSIRKENEQITSIDNNDQLNFEDIQTKINKQYSDSDDDSIFEKLRKTSVSSGNCHENHSIASDHNNEDYQVPYQSPETFTEFDKIRKFISKIENDSDSNDEILSSESNSNQTNRNVDDLFKHLSIPNIKEDSLSSTSSSIVDENKIKQFPTDEKSFLNEINENIQKQIIEEKSIETKRFSVVTCHSIPDLAKIYHMSCSSTYIYICTNKCEVFFAKLNLDQQLKWQKHPISAERLVVSITNRTVWRFTNKHLYASNDAMKFPLIDSQWNQLKIDHGYPLLSISITDQCGWFIKNDGTLWLVRTDDSTHQTLNVTCPFDLKTVCCFSEKVGVTTNGGEILIRNGCTNDRLEGDGWTFIEHNFGPIDDFLLLTNNVICLIDKKHRLWIREQLSEDTEWFEILYDDNHLKQRERYLLCVNSNLLCLTDRDEKIHIFSDSLTGMRWKTIENSTRLQRLIGAFANENYVWALTADKTIRSSNGQTLEKPRQAQYLTHGTFAPDNSSQNTILWALDESCSIYVRPNMNVDTKWEQLDQTQFGWNRRLIHIVCNNVGAWAVDEQGCIYFRHGHSSGRQNIYSDEISYLPPAWISIPGAPKRYRCFSQIYCGPADWMVYATDNKQNVYTRTDINEENRVGTLWKIIEDCSALELAISEDTLWLLTSQGEIQCRENISIENPIGTRSTTLFGRFLSLTVSVDDSQVWALDSKRNLLKLDRLIVLFEK